MDNIGKVFAERLALLLESRGKLQKQLAEHLGYRESTISQYKAGRLPPGYMLPKIAQFLNTSVDYLLGLADSPEPHDRGLGHLSPALILFVTSAANRQYIEVAYDLKRHNLPWAAIEQFLRLAKTIEEETRRGVGQVTRSVADATREDGQAHDGRDLRSGRRDQDIR